MHNFQNLIKNLVFEVKIIVLSSLMKHLNGKNFTFWLIESTKHANVFSFVWLFLFYYM